MSMSNGCNESRSWDPESRPNLNWNKSQKYVLVSLPICLISAYNNTVSCSIVFK